MNRRTFLQALGGVVAAGAAAPLLPIPAPPTVVDVTLKPLAFHPDAFELAMAPMERSGKAIDALQNLSSDLTFRPETFGKALHQHLADAIDQRATELEHLAFASGDQWPS